MRYAWIVAAALLAGCYSVGDRRISDEALIVTLENGVGKITREEVRQLLGRPMSVSPGLWGFSGETWMYMYTYGAVRPTTFIPYVGLFAGGSDMTSHTLTIRFDGQGRISWVGKGQTSGGGGGLQDAGRAPVPEPAQPATASTPPSQDENFFQRD